MLTPPRDWELGAWRRFLPWGDGPMEMSPHHPMPPQPISLLDPKLVPVITAIEGMMTTCQAHGDRLRGTDFIWTYSLS